MKFDTEKGRAHLQRVRDHCDLCCSDDPPWSDIEDIFGAYEIALSKIDELQDVHK